MTKIRNALGQLLKYIHTRRSQKDFDSVRREIFGVRGGAVG
jgi:hypothetical protein